MRQHDPAINTAFLGKCSSWYFKPWLTDHLITKTVVSYAKNCLSCRGEQAVFPGQDFSPAIVWEQPHR